MNYCFAIHKRFEVKLLCYIYTFLFILYDNMIRCIALLNIANQGCVPKFTPCGRVELMLNQSEQICVSFLSN